jgi:hypothetical protein
MAYGAYHARNPRGQQRDKLYREALRLALAEDPDVPPPKVTAADGPMRRLRGIARTHIAKAEAGDMQAIKELADRLDGRPAQILEHSDPNGELIRRELTYKIVHVTKTPEQIENEDPGGLLIEHKPVEGNGHDSEHVMSSENGRENGNGNGHG